MAKFGVGARVIDLLGRQQVAGTPTAISELFKNAHDAYARNADVDLYRSQDLFVLRDDGVGMTRRDFETRWLTAATDSKRNTGYISPPDTDADQPPRPVMGEKGIGRLAIAVLGKQVLALTRKKTLDASAPIVAAFIHWDIFRLPNVSLNDLEIPLREVSADSIPDMVMIGSMIDECRQNILALRPSTDGDLVDSILVDLDKFDVNPSRLEGVLVQGPKLSGAGHGTHFYIMPTHDALVLDIDSASDRDKATPMQKALLGFTNTMVPGHPQPPMVTSFRDHGKNGLWQDLIGENEFFTPAEYESADHRIAGRFDARGQFEGYIKVFGGEERPIKIHWPDAGGRDVRCGPFSVDFAYVQGAQADTRLPPDMWGPIIEKLNKIGGLYIYRNGMRVLPYGDSDYDFLDIEDRRTRKASYYFFSYRRMFGVIDISREANAELIEKAGREGFQENSAYKQFKNILRHFFIQLAAEYFRDGSDQAAAFLEQKAQNNRVYRLMERRQKQIGAKRRKLKADLDEFFSQTTVRGYDGAVRKVVERLRSELELETQASADATELRQRERDALAEIRAIDASARVVKARAVGLTKEQSFQLARYEVERRRLVEHVFMPALSVVQGLFLETVQRLGLAVQARKHAVEAISELGDRSGRQVKSLASGLQSGMQVLQSRVIDRARTSVRTVAEAIESQLIDFENKAAADLTDDEIIRIQTDVEQAIQQVTESQARILEQLTEQISRAATHDADDSDDILEAMETELEDRRERELENLELAQMGQAIGIVHHEFHSVIRSVRRNLKRLAPWAERNERLAALYRDINESYAHLDSYLALFAPLNRRLSQTKRVIPGSEIAAYLRQLLGDRLRRHDVELITTEAFLAVKVEEFASTLFPSFVNLVDNALFWVTHGVGESQSSRPRSVILDYATATYSISDSGPGVLPSDEELVFESGFSRKPSGSGLGLSITRNLLERHGYALSLVPYKPSNGATFEISIPDSALVDDEK